jgi:hypothetical protein
MNAHTAGPWNLYREKWGWCVGPGKAIGKGYIADVHETVNSNTGRPTKESVANANLIAAAPDLLEAAKLAEARIANHPEWCNTTGHNMLRAAIAKAEGQS